MSDLRRVMAVVVAGLAFTAVLGCREGQRIIEVDIDGGSDHDGSTSGGAGGGPSGTGGHAATGGQSGAVGQTGTGGMAGTGGAPGTGGAAPRSDGGPPMSDGGVDANGGMDARADLAGRDGGGDAANLDGGAAFAPCPPTGTACIILPLGDSITDGFPFENGGYRVELFHQTLLARQRVTFVGSLANGPAIVDGTAFPRNHEGHSGFTIDNAPTAARSGISPLTDNAIATFHPHIVLLLIGTNDVDLSVDLANAPTRLEAMVDRVIADAPNALLVVGQLAPTTTDAENVRFQTYNAAIPAIVQTRVAAGKHVLLADMYGAFTANASYKTALMNDNLHPNPAGYTLMGQTWYAAIRSYLPVGP